MDIVLFFPQFISLQLDNARWHSPSSQHSRGP